MYCLCSNNKCFLRKKKRRRRERLKRTNMANNVEELPTVATTQPEPSPIGIKEMLVPWDARGIPQ